MTLITLWDNFVAPQLESVSKTFLNIEDTKLKHIRLASTNGTITANVSLESKSLRKLLFYIFKKGPISFKVSFKRNQWFDVKLLLILGEHILLNLVMTFQNYQGLTSSFTKASELTWTATPSRSQFFLYNITVHNVAFGDWEVCRSNCVNIGMKQWYGMYQRLCGVSIPSEKVEVKPDQKKIEMKVESKVQTESSFFEDVVKSAKGMERIYDSVLNFFSEVKTSVIYFYSDFEKAYGAIYEFITADSITYPLKLPLAIDFNDLKLRFIFHVKLKNTIEPIKIDVQSIKLTKTKKGEDAIKVKFHPDSASAYTLASSLLTKDMSHITNFILIVDEKNEFNFFKNVQIHLPPKLF
ncbi:hypothetical protein HMI56_005382 [Coelomomyces lativittatus]|nr:hypothetical protein HMI56_005382 [Coelomomyces lativittatus]